MQPYAKQLSYVGVETFSIFVFSASLIAPEFVFAKFTWIFSKSLAVHIGKFEAL